LRESTQPLSIPDGATTIRLILTGIFRAHVLCFRPCGAPVLDPFEDGVDAIGGFNSGVAKDVYRDPR